MKMQTSIGWLTGVGVIILLLMTKSGPVLSALRINLAYVQLGNLAVTNPDTVKGGYFPQAHLSGALDQEAQSAMTLFSMALQQDQHDAAAAYGLGYVLLQMHDFSEAYRAFDAVTGGKEQLAVAWKMWAWAQSNTVLNLDRTKRIELGITLAQEARQFLVTARRSDSLVLYEVASQVAPEVLDTWLDRIELYANQWEQVIGTYQQAAQRFPAEPYMYLAGAYISLYVNHDRADAQRLVDRAMQTLAEIDWRGLSRTRVAWLYHGYIIAASLALQQEDKESAQTWLDKAAQLPTVSLDQGVNLKNLREIVKATH